MNTDSAVPGLNRNQCTRAESAGAPLCEQRRIAHLLGTLDDKIELNRRMNETLEDMARAIFKDWFVDFGPVRAKMAGREPYLPEEIWRLFPERLVESELGEVPEGWGVKTVDDLCVSITSGGNTCQKDNGKLGEGDDTLVQNWRASRLSGHRVRGTYYAVGP